MSEIYILIATFFGVLIFSSVVLLIVSARREVSARLNETTNIGSLPDGSLQNFVDGKLSKKHAIYINHYYNVVRNDDDKDSMGNRLIRAGFFAPNASAYFQTLRAIGALAAAVLAFVFLDRAMPTAPQALAMMASILTGGLVFILFNIVLERIGDGKQRQYRRLFPDFMDLLIICVDAGLSIESAINRVAREFLVTHPDFGLHLTIMTLEIRGGRPMRDALSNFAQRLEIEEAQSLAVLFRQSEELGASISKSLRVYSDEMRKMRIIRAEEKANALPIKMLFPIAVFLFPLSLLIAVVPMIMTLLVLLKSVGPPS